MSKQEAEQPPDRLGPTGPAEKQPEAVDLEREAEALGDGVERDQLHPPQPYRLDSGDIPGQQHGPRLVKLEDQLEHSLAQITPHEPHRRFSERGFLQRTLTPYLSEYPMLATDVQTLRQAKLLLRQPIEPPTGTYNGVFEEGGWAAEIRDRQLRTLFRDTWPDHLTAEQIRLILG